jgi:hypothetical protein
MEEVEEYEEMMVVRLIRQPQVYDRRADHMVVLNHAEFKRTFRFSEDGVLALVDLLYDQLHYPTQRGRPLSVLQQVLVALNHYAGGQFQRTTALCGGISQATVCRTVEEVSWAICQHKAKFLKMPSEEQMHATAAFMMNRYRLPRFAYAVDGMMVRFDNAPQNIPPTLVTQDFNCRKNFYAINCQVVANDELLICDLDVDWPGKTHDAKVWAWSDVRAYLEGGAVPEFYLLAGDSAYPISTVLVKPYSNREALDDALKRLFNKRLSSIRTRMSENVFARWKNTFPILRKMRAHYDHAKIIIIATAILHNLSIKFGEVEPEGDMEVIDQLREIIEVMEAPDAVDAEVLDVQVPAVGDPHRRMLGQIARDNLMNNLRRRR